MPEIKYTHTDEHGLDLIEPLWQRLIDYHKERSQHFSRHFANMKFNPKMKRLLEKSREGSLRIDLARDADTGELVGYCISTMSADKQGEIDSIYVEPEYRRTGIGDNLMKKALNWMEQSSVTRKVLEVGAGNEEVFAFYSRYHFYPRTITLEQVLTGQGE